MRKFIQEFEEDSSQILQPAMCGSETKGSGMWNALVPERSPPGLRWNSNRVKRLVVLPADPLCAPRADSVHHH